MRKLTLSKNLSGFDIESREEGRCAMTKIVTSSLRHPIHHGKNGLTEGESYSTGNLFIA